MNNTVCIHKLYIIIRRNHVLKIYVSCLIINLLKIGWNVKIGRK